MLECKRCVACRPQGATGGNARIIDVQEGEDEYFVPQEAEVVEDELCTWSHHRNVEGVPDEILKLAAKQCRGRGVTFTMGCHIVYTAEMIAKLEEEDRALQEQRQKAAVAQSMDATSSAPKRPKQSKQDAEEEEEDASREEQEKAVGVKSADSAPVAAKRRSRVVDEDAEDAAPESCQAVAAPKQRKRFASAVIDTDEQTP